ncbi:hypothetical protein STRCI_002641 [Streptomyces cinnabarinus]|uniref:Uncharacterized protein n=1 Tax=Streptomyces cinnabarinus TaxID=67287 RepID=A0ABY7KAB4_9ACTN|nr:hypothetical protein [Streptomyces cinnabarinus]WAZ21467.1 hypothetical protein STRCI_002641 [Streptomyces cinnabarinus]
MQKIASLGPAAPRPGSGFERVLVRPGAMANDAGVLDADISEAAARIRATSTGITRSTV